jgi:hypothetical protein
VDEASVRAALECYWLYAPRDQEIAHAMYHDDAVLEFPQSEERFEGKANFIAWRSIYPAAVECMIGRIRGQGSFWVAEVRIRYNLLRRRLASTAVARPLAGRVAVRLSPLI